MEAARERAREERSPSVERSPTRCPYCHDGIEDVAEALVCEACLARHHQACWQDRCASCAGRTALARVELLSRGGDASAPYEVWKRRLNGGYLLLFLAAFLATGAGMIVSSALGLMDPHQPPGDAFPGPWPMLPGFVLTCVLTLVIFPLSLVDAWDAWERRRRGGEVPVWAPALGLLAPCSGGLTACGYYLAWGRQPLPIGDRGKVAGGKD